MSRIIVPPIVEQERDQDDSILARAARILGNGSTVEKHEELTEEKKGTEEFTNAPKFAAAAKALAAKMMKDYPDLKILYQKGHDNKGSFRHVISDVTGEVFADFDDSKNSGQINHDSVLNPTKPLRK